MYAAIEAITLREGPPVSAVSEVWEVSRSAYHAWLTRDPSVREERDAVLSPLVHDIFGKHKRRYGARRIVEDLARSSHERRVQSTCELASSIRYAILSLLLNSDFYWIRCCHVAVHEVNLYV